jgi:hypothetical protein
VIHVALVTAHQMLHITDKDTVDALRLMQTTLVYQNILPSNGAASSRQQQWPAGGTTCSSVAKHCHTGPTAQTECCFSSHRQTVQHSAGPTSLLRRLVVGLSSRRPELDSRPVFMIILVTIATMGHFRLAPCLCHRCCTV